MTGLARWWFAPAPATRLAAFRILLGSFASLELAVRLISLFHYARFPAAQFRPVGVVTLLDHPLPPLLADAITIATLALALAFALGWRYRITGPLFALTYLWTTSYRNAWGMIFHTENLAVLHAGILAFAPAADAWSLDARNARRRAAGARAPDGAAPAIPDGTPPATPDPRYGWALRAAAVVTILTYVLAGIAKLRLAGGVWLAGDQLRNQIAFDNLRRVVYGADASLFATPLLAHPWIFQALALLTLVVELGAPLALVHRRVAAAWAAAAWGFHVGVVALMHIVFPYHLVALAYAPLFPLERLLLRVRTRRRSAPG